MTLKRTIHRRKARQRAKAFQSERTRRRIAMTPEDREIEREIAAVIRDAYESAIRDITRDMYGKLFS